MRRGTADDKTVRIPVRMTERGLEYLYGGPLPALANGAVGELVVPQYAVQDPSVVQRLLAERVVPLLPPDSKLRVRVVSQPSDTAGVISSNNGQFVEVRLDGEMCLRLRGSKKATLDPVSVVIPALDGARAQSLNVAYRLISERFEPNRVSHAGNVFFEVFVRMGDRWRPLDDLRSECEARNESSLTVPGLNSDGRRE